MLFVLKKLNSNHWIGNVFDLNVIMDREFINPLNSFFLCAGISLIT